MNDPTSRSSDPLNAAVTPGAVTSSWHTTAAWLAIILLFVIEYGMFRQYALREVVWSYPIGYDQTSYISFSYEIYEKILSEGLRSGIEHGLRNGRANGLLLEVQASLLYLVLGPSRLSALTLNFIYFALFQLVLVATLRWYSNRWSVSFLGLGLLLTAANPFSVVGGIMDFRIDFVAFCLFGMLICTVVRSNMFRSLPWSLAAASVGALLILCRFLTMPYMVGIAGLFFGLLSFRLWFHWRNPVHRLALLRQWSKLVLAGVVFSAITVPVALYKWPMIRDYYITHLQNGENEVRAQEFGYVGTMTRLLYYPRSLLVDHAGWAFLILSGIVVLAALVLGRLSFRTNRLEAGQNSKAVAMPMVFALLCLVVPVVVLTSYSSPSPVVGSIGVGALLWVVLLITLWLMRLPRSGADPKAVWGMNILAAAGMLTGVCYQADAFSRQSPHSQQRAEYEKIVHLYDVMGQHCRDMKWTAPRITQNVTCEFLLAAHVRNFAYEHQRILLNPREMLARVAWAPEDEAMMAMKKSDFVILCKHSPTFVYPYPFNQAMQELYPKMLAACDKTHIPIHRLRLFGEEVILYVRAAPAVTGTTKDGWITSEGLLLSAPGALLRGRPRIELRGSALWEVLDKVPAVSAELIVPGQTPRMVPVALAANGARYAVTINLQSEDIPDVAQVDIHLSFDSYFVPSEMSGSSDTRRLVVRAPDEALLLSER
jgi:hypothetical protein